MVEHLKDFLSDVVAEVPREHLRSPRNALRPAPAPPAARGRAPRPTSYDAAK